VIEELREILISVNSRTVTSSKLLKLVHLTRKIAETFLLQYRSRFLILCEQSGVTFSDLATDCVAEMFHGQGKGRFPRLEQFLASLPASPELMAPVDIFFAYKSLVIDVTKARLARAFSEIDPQGARLTRNVKEAIKRGGVSLQLAKTLRGYLMHPIGIDPPQPGEPWPINLMERQLLQWTKADKIPDILKSTAEILTSQHEYQKWIYLNEYVSVLKGYFASLNLSEFDTGNTQLSEISDVDLLILKDRALKAVQKKVITTYLDRVSVEEGRALVRTVNSIMEEWINQKDITNSYAAHAARAFSITEGEYRAKWRTKVEYLVKIAKEVFEAYWLRDF